MRCGRVLRVMCVGSVSVPGACLNVVPAMRVQSTRLPHCPLGQGSVGRVVRVLHLLYPCPKPEKKSKKGKEKSKKQKEKKKEKEQTKEKKKEGKEKKTRGQTPKKKKEEAAEEGGEGKEEEEEEDDEIVLLGKKQARVALAKAEVARMTAAGTWMGRQVRSTLLERDDPMSPDGGKGRSGSGSEPSSSGSSSTSTRISSRSTTAIWGNW